MDASLHDMLMQRVSKAIDNIRPYLEADGGDVRVIGITEDFMVEVELLGACGTCPMSPTTMKAGIEDAVMRVAPEIKGIRAVNLQSIQ